MSLALRSLAAFLTVAGGTTFAVPTATATATNTPTTTIIGAVRGVRELGCEVLARIFHNFSEKAPRFAG